MTWSDLTAGALSACRDAFGEAVTYTPQGGSPLSITGIWNAKSYEADADGFKVLTATPSLGIVVSDLDGATPKEQDTLVRAGTTYKVASVDLDGEGGARLLLRKGS